VVRAVRRSLPESPSNAVFYRVSSEREVLILNIGLMVTRPATGVRAFGGTNANRIGGAMASNRTNLCVVNTALRKRCRRALRTCSEVSNRGAQLDFPAQQLQGVTEVWVRFEEAIVIGWR
jgi:hypothetical protein